MDADIIIAGAGPAGLSLAASFAGGPVKVLVLERGDGASISAPAYDGREIALTNASVAALKRLGAWAGLADDEIALLQCARVLNGRSLHSLDFHNSKDTSASLGVLVANSAIRRALFNAVRGQPNIDIRYGAHATSATGDSDGARVELDDGQRLSAKLVVAADTRFSALRRNRGIAAHMFDFGKAMVLARVRHTRPHLGIATEWFDYGQTIAMLPLTGDMSSLVATLPEKDARQLMDLSEQAFAKIMDERTARRWGALELASERFLYPLVATYARRFVAERFALVGDAAVGMHPVTAHGFNLGLLGAVRLGEQIRASHRGARDVGRWEGLAAYERGHRQATAPLFLATNAIASLYTDERPPARLARAAGIEAMRALAPARRIVEAWLGASASPHSQSSIGRSLA